MQKGWSSERVPLSTNGARRQMGTALMPLNSGSTLPSKWDDAERWICSPVSGNGSLRQHIAAPQRRPKSKSGPLGPPRLANYSLYSPVAPMFERGNEGSFVVDFPISTGVIAANGSTICAGDYGADFEVVLEPRMARFLSMHGCSNWQNGCPLPSNGDNIVVIKDAATDISHAVSMRDMATQISPQGSVQSSPKGRPSFSSSTPNSLHIMELESIHFSKSELRDVLVDERLTVTRWSNKHQAHQGRRSEIVDDWRKKIDNGHVSAWDVSESAKSISKLKREEAKITAWENLQKAKAEADILELEMKLEKKRSSSMDKIVNKLKSAQKKAKEMRSSMVANHGGQVTRSSHKSLSFHRTRRIGSGCFTAFTCMLPSA